MFLKGFTRESHIKACFAASHLIHGVFFNDPQAHAVRCIYTRVTSIASFICPFCEGQDEAISIIMNLI